MNYYYKYKNTTKLIGQDIDISWAFFLCVDEIPDLCAWKKEFAVPKSSILNQRGNRITPEDLEILITVRYTHNPECANGNKFIGSHNLIHRKVGMKGSTTFRRLNHDDNIYKCYMCIANEDCWDLCLTKW